MPEGDTLASRYGSARSFLSQQAHLNHPYRPRAVAANLLVRRAAFEQIGGFYEGVRAAEDTDFSWRLQQAGWRLELRRGAEVEHRYRVTLRELRRQWRGYAAGRAWLGRRYDGFDAPAGGDSGVRPPAPARARRRTTGTRSGRWVFARGPPRPTSGRLERGRYLALDALLSVDELAGLALSNRPAGRASARPPRSWSWPTASRARKDPLAEFVGTLGHARVEAAARPESPCAVVSQALRIDYREDDGMAARAAAQLALIAAPSVALRGRPAGTPPGRAEPVGAGAGGIAPAARSSRARACDRRRGAPRHRPAARAAGRLGRSTSRGIDALMRVQMVDPSAFTRPYDHALCAALAARGGRRRRADHQPVRLREVPSPDGYAVRELFYRRAVGAPGSPARLAPSWSSTCPDMLRYRALAAAADVVHFQWLAVQASTGGCCPSADGPDRARPASARAPAGAGAGPAAALRRGRRGGGALGVRTRAAGVRARGRPGEGAGHPPRRVQAPDADGARGPLPAEPRGRRDAGRAVLRPAPAVQGRRDAARGLAGGLRRGAVDRRAAADADRAVAGTGRRPVRFVPRFVSDAELPAFFRRADVVVLPYARTERLDWSGVLATALAFGKPIVVSDVGGFGEVADLGAARLVAPGDPDALREALAGLLGRFAGARGPGLGGADRRAWAVLVGGGRPADPGPLSDLVG